MLRSSAEYGKGPEVDDLETEDGAEVEEVITGVHQEILAAVDLTPENSNTLHEIFDLARASYDKESKLWEPLFANLTSELTAAPDDDEASDILDQYRRKAIALK